MKYLIPVSLLLLHFACSPDRNQEEQIRDLLIDQGSLFTNSEASILRQKIQFLEDSIGSQICVFTVATIGDQAIDAFSLEKAEDLRLGRKDYDDGVLITVASQDRKVRIEVGYGLENIIRDEIAAGIIRELMIPNFADGNYFEGVATGIDSMSYLIVARQELIGSEPTWPGKSE